MRPPPDPHVPQTEGLLIGDHRLSTSCGVVEWPDHYCGDDLVLVMFSDFRVIVLLFHGWACNSCLSKCLRCCTELLVLGRAEFSKPVMDGN